MRRPFSCALILSSLCAAACGGSVSDGNGASGGDDTGAVVTDDTGVPGDDTDVPPADTDVPPVDAPPADAGPDHGAPSDTYPAFPPDLPQLQFQGGSVLKSPVIVTVTYSGDPNAATFEAFGDAIGASAYWKAVTSEYGVGPAVSGTANHVSITTAPPATLSDRDIRTMVSTNAGTVWPAPTDGTIYTIYVSPSTKVTSFGGSDICASGVGGYHSSARVGTKSVAYAVLPQCKGGMNPTSSASHELAEAATDPFQSAPAYVRFDTNHAAWELFQQFNDENGDACEFYVDSFYTESETSFSYAVQRQWSNAAAKAGKSPCVPQDPAEPYFNVTPLGLEDVTADYSGIGGPTAVKTKGYKIAVGDTRTIELGLWSEAKRAAWNLKAVEGNPLLGTVTPHLTVSLDLAKGVNGQKAFLTVKVNSAGTGKNEFVSVESYVFGIAHWMPILISN
jgi:hypothetical protein